MFYLCRKCDRVFVSISGKPKKCDQCNEPLEEKKNKFILQCKSCLEYYPRRILALSIREGRCICLNPKCKADLTIRYQISELSIMAAKTEKEQEDLIKEQVSINLDLPKKPKNEVKKEKSPQKIEIEDDIDTLRQAALANQVQQDFKKMGNEIKVESPVILDLKEKNPEVLPPIVVHNEKVGGNGKKKKDFSDLICDPLTMDPKLTEFQLRELFQQCLKISKPTLELTLGDYTNIMVNLIIEQHMNNSVIKEEEIPTCAYFIGSLSGDFVLLQKLIQHFQEIIRKKPEIKFIFLGNIIGPNPNNLDTLILLYLFYLNYPENVIILRGSHEIKEKAGEIGFWNQIEQRFIADISHIDQIPLLSRYILCSFAHLPLFHLGTMQGPIAVLSTHSGIPHFENISKQVFRIDHDLEAFFWGAEKMDQLDSFTAQILFGIPQEALSQQPPFTATDITFKKDTFFQFIQENHVNYLVRSHTELAKGVEYSYGGYMCSVFSTSKYTQPTTQEFQAKIIRLTPGQSPREILPTPEDFQKDLAELPK